MQENSYKPDFYSDLNAFYVKLTYQQVQGGLDVQTRIRVSYMLNVDHLQSGTKWVYSHKVKDED